MCVVGCTKDESSLENDTFSFIVGNKRGRTKTLNLQLLTSWLRQKIYDFAYKLWPEVSV